MSARRYRVEFSRPADRQFRGLPADIQRRIAPKINALAGAPRPRGAVKLEGAEDLYRLRVGDYRVLYQILDRVLVILVVALGHRREVYRR